MNSKNRGYHLPPLRAVLAALVFVVAGCKVGNQDDSPVEDGPVPAGAQAAQLGIGAYSGLAVLTTGDPTVTFTVTSPEGAPFGTVSVSYGADTEVRAVYTAHSGQMATYRAWNTFTEGATQFNVYEEVTVGALSLETHTVGATGALATDAPDGGDWIATVTLSTPLGTTTPPPTGGMIFDGETPGGRAALVAVENSSVAATESEIAFWFERTGLLPLVNDPAAVIMMASLHDPELIDAVEARLDSAGLLPERSGMGSSSHALHQSPVCGLVQEIIETDPNQRRVECCRACTSVDPDRYFNPFHFAYLVACDCCSTSIALGLTHLFDCARARTLTEDHWTDQRCQAERPAPGNGAILLATEDGHGCQAQCDPTACNDVCAAALNPRGIPFTATCSSTDNATCNCNPDPEAACRALHANYCGGAVLSDAVLLCTTAACGDTQFSPECTENPLFAEICDGTATTTGCGVGESCTDCLGCDPCQCTPGATPSGCAENETCTSNCTCMLRPSSCGFRAPSSDEHWCNPTFGTAACPAGTVCIPETCECTYCGDGFVNGSETCEDDVAGASCTGERTCQNCQCISNCGNGTVDPGEHCDSATGGGCDTGYVCTNCTCVVNQAVCGDARCDRAGGENETNCAGDCPVVCGDGVCNSTGGENTSSCPSDCNVSQVQCCVDTGGCPSEGLYDCPGECCCCPSGAHCVNPSGTWICGI